jgi:hypothetical protein
MARGLTLRLAASALLAFWGSVAEAGLAEEQAMAYEGVKLTTTYGGNFTETENLTWKEKGWVKSKLCLDEWCIFANKDAVGGRGIVIVTFDDEMENIKEVVEKMAIPKPSKESKFHSEPTEDGDVLLADEVLRRGKQLVSAAPVLMVEHSFINETTKEEQAAILEAAVQLLPGPTQELISSRRKRGSRTASMGELIRQHPIDVTPNAENTLESDKHLLYYPELGGFSQHCRPNTAWHIDHAFTLHTTVARKISPGEPLSISHLPHLLTRANRQAYSEGLFGKACSCDACTGKGDLMSMAKSDERVEEAEQLGRTLEDIEANVTADMIARYLSLYEAEALQAFASEAYWRAAINYNYIGKKDDAVKWANKAVQAAIVQWGKDTSAIIEMRIFLQDPLGHYSYRRRLSLKGQ